MYMHMKICGPRQVPANMSITQTVLVNGFATHLAVSKLHVLRSGSFMAPTCILHTSNLHVRANF